MSEDDSGEEQQYEIDVDESELAGRECPSEDCRAITIGVMYEPNVCALCGQRL